MSFKLWLGISLIVLGIISLFVYKEKIKRKLQERIERNSVKIPNVQWTKRNGEVVTEDIILKRSRLPLIGDWSRIYPVINEDGKVSTINLVFGGMKNFLKVLLMLAIVAMFLIGYYEVFSSFEAYKETCIQIGKQII